jgi:YesN/AraC family two-component response regulator
MAKNNSTVGTVFFNSIYEKREEGWAHVSYEKELVLLDLLKKGDVDGVRKKSLEIFKTRIHNAHLSANILRQRKYEFVAAAAVLSRFSIEAGLDVETSFSLSDAYIRSVDQAISEEEVLRLLQKMPLDFTERIRVLKKITLSGIIKRSVEYIEKNLHYDISLNDLANLTEKNASYLSTLFKKEIGMSMNSYVIKKRLEEAALILSESEVPVSEIATTLSFGSQSYFTLLFKKHYGKTPKEYRKEHFPTHKNRSD